jgi:hypothetical protein
MIGSPLARHASRPPNTTSRIWPASRSCLSGAGSCHHNTTSDGQRQVPDWKGEVVEHSGPHVLGHGTEKERDEAERRGNARLGRPPRNPRSPTAPAAFSAPNIGSHAVETPSCAEFFRTNVADAKSASACRYWPRWRRRCRPVGGSWLAIPPPSALRSPPNICATVPPIDLPQIAGTDPLCPRARRHRVAYGTGDLGLFGGWPIGGSFSP